MTIQALSITRLIEMMSDATKRTFDPSLRYWRESDTVLYGKVSQLDVIAEDLLLTAQLSEAEDAALCRASAELHSAFYHLADSADLPR